MISRRTVLERALSLGAGAALLPTITPAEAARLLDAPAGDPVPELGATTFTDPARFAREYDGHTPDGVWGDVIEFSAPAEYAAYAQAREAMLRSLPLLADVPFDHPWNTMDEAVGAWATVAYMRGCQAGAAYEALRRALVGPIRSCARCHAKGVVGLNGRQVYDHDLVERTTCPDCGGKGVIAA